MKLWIAALAAVIVVAGTSSNGQAPTGAAPAAAGAAGRHH